MCSPRRGAHPGLTVVWLPYRLLVTAARRTGERTRLPSAKRRWPRSEACVGTCWCASLRSCAEPGARVLMFAACQEASCEVLVASYSVWWLAYGRDFQKSRMCGAQRHTVHVEQNRLAIGLPTHPPFMAAATRSCHRLPCGSNVITRLSSSSPCPQFPVCCMNTSSLLRGANSPRRSAHSIRHTSGEWAEQPQSR